MTDLHSLAIQLFFQTSQFILVLKIHLTYHPTTNPFNLYISISTLTRTTYFFRQKQVQFVLALQLYKWVDFPPYWIHWHTVLGLGTFTWSIGNQGVKLVFIGIILAKSEAYLKFKFRGKGNIAHPPHRYPRVTIEIGWCFPRASSDTKILERFWRRRRYALVRGKTCPIKDKFEVRIAETLVCCVYNIIIWNLFLFQNKVLHVISAIWAYLYLDINIRIKYTYTTKVSPWFLVKFSFVITGPSFREEIVLLSAMWCWWSFLCFRRLFWTFDFSSLFFVFSRFPFRDLDFDFLALFFKVNATGNFVEFFVLCWRCLMGFLLGFIISFWSQPLVFTFNNPSFTANKLVSIGISVLTPGFMSLLTPGLERGRSSVVIERSVRVVIGLFSTNIVTSRLVTHRHRWGI